ncbi:MAG: T9SS type B sorting domain-containing protein, partial [Flavobacteriales bacterium]|nr:T9SS type B sorting domain-containing protein [Flavobacteriales bacterium]
VPSATFNITSFIDNADPNGCEIPITNASQTVTFSTQPNAGTPPLINPIFCLGDPTIDLSTLLSNNPDVGGTWTYTSGPGPAPLNMPFGGLNYMFDPSTNPAGDYTYTASNSPCLDHTSTITIILDPGPIAGQLPLIPVNMCMGETINLNNEFITNPFPNTPVWTSNGNGISNNFTPTLSGAYTFRSTITDPASSCPDVWAEIDIEVHDLPTVLFSTVNQICLGENLDLSFVLTGVAPFTITVTDNILPPFNVIVDINGNDFITGNPITYTPSNSGITNLTVTNISDAFCSITTAQNSVVAVSTPPNSGVLILPLSVCEDDLSVYNLSNQLAGQDLTGYWIDANGVQQPTSPSFNFDVSMPSGNYTYVVTSAICTTAQTIVPVAVINTPITGSANPQEICINDYGAGNLYNLNNLLTGSYDPGTWYESGVPIPTNINPSTYGVGTTTFTYQVNGIPPCANATINVDLTINPEPVVLSFTSFNPITGLPASSTTQGYAIGLDVTMLVGAVPFTINISDDDSPFNTGSIFIASGMSGSTTMMPNVLPTTTYDVSLITDGNGCTTTYNGTVPVTVIPYPIVTFSTLTPEICENEIATIEFNLVQGVVPVTVDYVLHGNSYTEILNSVGVTTVNIPNPNLIFGINTFSVSSIIDVNLEAAPNIPNDIQIVYNQNPSVTFSTTTPVICYKDDAILQLDFSAGAPPFTVNYSDNGIPVIPPLIFNNLGTQTSTLSPDPSPGDHPYDIIDIIDANLCVGTIVNTENILVRELPELDIVISGDNPICFGDFSELSFPVLSGSPPFNLSLLEESNSITLNVDAAGLVSGSPYQIPNPGQYTTTYTLTSVTDANTCTQSLSDSKTLIVNEIPVVDVSGTTEICKDDYTNINFDFSAGTPPWTLFYNINGIVGTPFDLDSISDRIVVSPTTTSIYTYTAIEDSNGCKDNFTDAATITVNPLPEMEVTGGGEVCNDGSTVDVIFNTSNGTPTFDFEYTVGINTKYVSNVGYQHIIATNEAGTYIVTNITDDKGCVGKSITGIADVIVHPMPVADFDVYPQPADVTNPVINFTDNSTGHIAGTWDFDDNSTTNTNFGKLSHRFSDLDSGTYYVELYVESNKGCWDTQLQKIVIDNAFIFYIPNSFTPNNDMVNDLFFPYIEGVKEYDFYIYSRQGQEIFHTTDVNEGWDGYVANGDNYAISGKYAYAIYIIDLHGKERKYQGHFLLIR